MLSGARVYAYNKKIATEQTDGASNYDKWLINLLSGH